MATLTRLLWQSGGASIVIDGGSPVQVTEPHYEVQLTPGNHLVRLAFANGQTVEQSITVPDVVSRAIANTMAISAIKGYFDIINVEHVENAAPTIHFKVKELSSGLGAPYKVVYGNNQEVVLTFNNNESQELQVSGDKPEVQVVTQDGTVLDRIDFAFAVQVAQNNANTCECWTRQSTTTSAAEYKSNINTTTQVGVVAYGDTHHDFTAQLMSGITFRVSLETTQEPNKDYKIARVFLKDQTAIDNLQPGQIYKDIVKVLDPNGVEVDRVPVYLQVKKRPDIIDLTGIDYTSALSVVTSNNFDFSKSYSNNVNSFYISVQADGDANIEIKLDLVALQNLVDNAMPGVNIHNKKLAFVVGSLGNSRGCNTMTLAQSTDGNYTNVADLRLPSEDGAWQTGFITSPLDVVNHAQAIRLYVTDGANGRGGTIDFTKILLLNS